MHRDVGLIVLQEIGKQGIQKNVVALGRIRHRPLDQLAYTVAYHIFIFLQSMRGKAVQGKRVVDGCAEIRNRVDQRPVKIENDKFPFHDAKITRFRLQ